MYENTSNSLDWKGLFLKVIIAFLVVIIAITGYKTFKGNNKNENSVTTKVAESKTSSTFTANIEKLKQAGEKYYNNNSDKKPKEEGVTSMVTLNELITSGEITTLTDEDGKTCDGESSYVTAIKEGNKTKIKANLVCGDSSSYSIVYLGENDTEVNKETVTTTTNNGSTQTTNTSSTSSKNYTTNTSNTGCTTSTCTPQVSVTTNNEVSSTVTINKGNSNSSSSITTNRSYSVKFDANGGTKYYRTQIVNENEKAYNPGENYKSGYRFKGWYLNGVEFNFNTPITEDITLIAKYTKTSSSSYYDDDDYDYRYGDLRVGYEYTYVYTMAWFEKGTDNVKVTHTLRLPEEIEDIDNIVDVKISDIEFSDGITHTDEVKTYERRHEDTFFYDYDKYDNWYTGSTTTNSLSTIYEEDVRFSYSQSDSYKDIDDAEDEGFKVTWRTTDVAKQCRTTFSVNGQSNLCNYGIVYKVTWQYRYYE